MRLVRRKARRIESFEKLQLEKVIGLTTVNANGLACNSTTGDVAYLAGCVVVIYNPRLNCQTRFLMVSRTPKAITCVTYSHQGGKLVAAGESGHQPAVIVWDASNGSCLADMRTHKYGISCVEFSPNGKHLVSVGFPHDGFLCLWDWKSGTLVSKVRATTASLPISGIHFATDGSFFVTAGANHLKRWTIGMHSSRPRSGIGMGTLAMDGKNVNLGSLKESSFVSVTSAEDSRDGVNEIQAIYALTNTGILCLLHFGFAIKKWVNLKVRQGYGLAISGAHIACACSDGIVRIFMVETLAFTATLPQPAPNGFHGLTDADTCAYLAMHNVNGITYPDAIACRFATEDKLAVMYGDHSFFVWDVQSFSKVGRYHAFLYHSACIWDVTNLPTHQVNMVTTPISNSFSCKGKLHGQGAFATCSADGSIRLWCLDCENDEEGLSYELRGSAVMPANAYNKDILGVLYTEKQGEPADKSTLAESVDSSHGFRSISVSSDGHYLAAGDRSGNLHVYDLNSLQRLSFQEAHDAEILTLSFGTLSDVAGTVSDNQVKEVSLLASGGRDRLVHIYDASRNFDVIETLDDHSASITTTKFACNGSKLLSCSADKSVVFRNIESTDSGFKSTRYHQEMASRGTIYDMDIDPFNKLAVTVGQDKKLNVLSLATGKCVRCFKPEGEAGEPIKVRVDPSGTYIVCSHSDKCMRIYDFANGDLLTLGQGHSEVITGVTFLPDCKRLISVSGDSCIFVWRLPSILTKTMRKKCLSHSGSQNLQTCMQLSTAQHHHQLWTKLLNKNKISADDMDTGNCEGVSSTPNLACLNPNNASPAFKFSVSRLPHWAQAKVSETIVEKEDNELEVQSFHSSESRWVERLGPEGYKLFSEPQELTPPATIRPSGFGLRRRFTIECAIANSENTPESSLESQPSRASASSPKGSQRKETHWKTVHTLIFDEEDYFQDDGTSEGGHLMPVAESQEETSETKLASSQKISSGSPIVRGKEQELQDGSDDDGVVVYLSEDEQESGNLKKQFASVDAQNDKANYHKEGTGYKTPAPLVCMTNKSNERAFTLFSQSKQSALQQGRFEYIKETQVSEESVSEIWRLEEGDVEKSGQPEQVSVPTVEELSDEDEANEDDFSPQRDFFSAHFDKLSTAIKVETGQASARSSFSARFFARASHSMPVASLFQNSPAMETTRAIDKRSLSPPNVENIEAGSLLATERERLKIRERQDNMALEVQRMREHLAHLGITAAETSPFTEKQRLDGESAIKSSPDDGQQCKSAFINCVSSHPTMGDLLETQHDRKTNSAFPLQENQSARKTSIAEKKTTLASDEEDHQELEQNVLPCEAGSQGHTTFTVAAGCGKPALNCAFVSGFDKSAENDTFEVDKENIDLKSLQTSSAQLNPQLRPSLSLAKDITECIRYEAMEVALLSDKWGEACLNSPSMAFEEQNESVIGDIKQPGSEFSAEVLQHTLAVTADKASSPKASVGQSTGVSLETLELLQPIEEYKNALQDLVQAADRALNLFRGLESMPRTEVNASMPNLSGLHQEFIPATLQKVWSLSDCMALSGQFNNLNALPCEISPTMEFADNFSLEHCSLRSSNNGIQSRPGTAASLAPTDSMLESVDIEGFIQRYSVRFSETLASQVLALVQKGLTTQPR